MIPILKINEIKDYVTTFYKNEKPFIIQERLRGAIIYNNGIKKLADIENVHDIIYNFNNDKKAKLDERIIGANLIKNLIIKKIQE